MTTQQTYNFDNLCITRTRIQDSKTNMRFLTVERNEGEYWLQLSPKDPDYSKAIKLMLNKENESAAT